MPTNPSTDVVCRICGVVLANQMELEEHMEVHAEQRAEGEPTIQRHHCSFCTASFRTPEELRDHNRTAHAK